MSSIPSPTATTATTATTAAGSAGPAVLAEGLRKTHGRGDAAVHALRGVDLAVPRGTFTAVMGPSGSGKSTLLHCLAGLDAPTAGRVVLAGTDTGRLSDRELTLLRRERVGFVFQAFNLLPVLTAEQNVLLPTELGGRGPRAARAEVRAWFDVLVDVLALGDRLRHRPAELSGGQQQRVAIARALVTRPEVVFADEPTGNLDLLAGAQVLALLRRSVRELDQTVVMVTHDAVAASSADRVLLLADGRLAGEVTDPTPEAVTAALDALRSDATATGSTGPLPVAGAAGAVGAVGATAAAVR